MHLKKVLAAFALLCVTGVASAQSCAGHAHGKVSSSEGMATITRTLNLTEDQQATFNSALEACHKDCATVPGEDAGAKAKRAARFDVAMAAMRESLSPEQATKFDAMKERGELNGLCAVDGGKACCAGKAAAGGKSCCAGKAAAPADGKGGEQGLKPAPAPEKKQ